MTEREFYLNDNKFHDTYKHKKEIQFVQVFFEIVITNNSSRPKSLNDCQFLQSNINTNKTIDISFIYPSSKTPFIEYDSKGSLNCLKIDSIEPYGTAIRKCFFNRHNLSANTKESELLFQFKDKDFENKALLLDDKYMFLLLDSSKVPRLESV